MGKNILVAFDDSDNAMRAVSYLAESFEKDSRITLFSVIPDSASLCQMNSPELTPYFKSQQSSFCLLEDKKKELVETALKKAKSMLVDAGFDPSNITLKLHTKTRGVARDIVDESESGYDLLVIGRRGISGIKEFFMGSISQKVFSLAKSISVLIVN
jgi:nucleotide-binding universal stress UspA family protein